VKNLNDKINSSPQPPSLGKKRRGSRRKPQKSITFIKQEKIGKSPSLPSKRGI